MRGEANGIPPVFFARADRWLDPLADSSPINARKPMYIDTRIPLALELLARIAGDADRVVLTEALPTHGDAPRAGDGRHLTELQAEIRVTARGPRPADLG